MAKTKAQHYADLYVQPNTHEGASQIKLVNTCHCSTLGIGQVMNIKDADHRVLRDPPAILQCWKKYFDSTCNEEFLLLLITSADNQPISPAEVELAIKTIKNRKARGPDDIPAEVWKLLVHRGDKVLAQLFNKIIDKGATPSACAGSVMVPIWKGKGDICEINACLRKIISIRASGWSCTDCASTSRRLITWSVGPNGTIRAIWICTLFIYLLS